MRTHGRDREAAQDHETVLGGGSGRQKFFDVDLIARQQFVRERVSHAAWGFTKLWGRSRVSAQCAQEIVDGALSGGSIDGHD